MSTNKRANMHSSDELGQYGDESYGAVLEAYRRVPSERGRCAVCQACGNAVGATHQFEQMLTQYATAKARKRSAHDSEEEGGREDEADGGSGEPGGAEPGGADDRKKRRRTGDADSSHMQQLLTAQDGGAAGYVPVYRCNYCTRSAGAGFDADPNQVFAQLMAAYAARSSALAGDPGEFVTVTTRLMDTVSERMSDELFHEEVIQECRRLITAL